MHYKVVLVHEQNVALAREQDLRLTRAAHTYRILLVVKVRRRNHFPSGDAFEHLEYAVDLIYVNNGVILTARAQKINKTKGIECFVCYVPKSVQSLSVKSIYAHIVRHILCGS